MKCPECQAGVSDSAKFCGKCGTKLLSICSSCGSENPLGNNFCEACGQNLTQPHGPAPTELSFHEKLDKIQRYLPKGLTEKILSQRDKIEGERKQVTVMFCDLEGFTPLVERLGAEEAYAIMDQVYEILIHKVHDYEGTVNEMTGDGIMALFGAPIALEDAPQRAIRSAYAIHKEMAKFSDTLKEETKGIPPLKMRVGIHSGPVVVGTLGNNLRVEFKAVGDTVNLASRMEGLAEPGTTYVTEDTFKLTEGLFRFEALGVKEIKGRKDPVRAYRVIAPSSRRTRFDVSAERGLTPFVGRERELELLLDSFQRTKAQRGQAFSIMAEAGVGKSRLLYEFRKAIENEDVTFLEGKCLSYSRGVAYHPITDILKSTFNVQGGESDSEVREKVSSGLRALRVDEPATLPYVLELMSVKDSGIEKIMLSPEGKKDQLIEALKRIVLKSSEIRPLILAFEDLHWVDKSSEDALKELLDSIPGAAVFLIFTYRPDYVHTWGGKSYSNQVTLSRLSNRESLSMLAYLLGTPEIDANLEELILTKTEGVPFFIEEFVKSLEELKFIERTDGKCRLAQKNHAVTIPSTIQHVIMARVDSLPEQAREVLQTGSAIEREFSYGLIREVTGLPEKELLSDLSALKDSELLFERGIFPDSTYIFKHAVTREVVYDSITAKRKKKLHEDVGHAIEELHKGRIEEQYGVLAEHYILSGNYAEAAECSRQAARKAEKAASFVDAASYAEKWVDCLERLPRTAQVEKQIMDARTTLGLYQIQLQHYPDAFKTVEPIVELAQTLDYKRQLAGIYTIFGIYWYENLPKAVEYLQKAIQVAEEMGNLVAFIFGNHYLGHLFADECEFEKGHKHIQKGLEIVEMRNVRWSIAIHTSCIAHTIYFQQGKMDLAYQTSREGLRLAEESGDLFSKAEGYVNHGACCWGKGYFDEAEEHLVKGKRFSERGTFFSQLFLANVYLGLVYCSKENYSKAENHFAEAISLLEKFIELARSLLNLAQIALLYSKVMGNEKSIDLAALHSAAAQKTKKRYEGFIYHHVGAILMNLGGTHDAEAEQWMQKAIQADDRNGMRFQVGLDRALYGEYFRRQGDRTKAQEQFGKAIDILRECGADGWVEKYEKELATLS